MFAGPSGFENRLSMAGTTFVPKSWKWLGGSDIPNFRNEMNENFINNNNSHNHTSLHPQRDWRKPAEVPYEQINDSPTPEHDEDSSDRKAPEKDRSFLIQSWHLPTKTKSQSTAAISVDSRGQISVPSLRSVRSHRRRRQRRRQSRPTDPNNVSTDYSGDGPQSCYLENSSGFHSGTRRTPSNTLKAIKKSGLVNAQISAFEKHLGTNSRTRANLAGAVPLVGMRNEVDRVTKKHSCCRKTHGRRRNSFVCRRRESFQFELPRVKSSKMRSCSQFGLQRDMENHQCPRIIAVKAKKVKDRKRRTVYARDDDSEAVKVLTNLCLNPMARSNKRSSFMLWWLEDNFKNDSLPLGICNNEKNTVNSLNIERFLLL